MNYFAHGRTFIDDPYFLAGTAVPDWLCVVDRRVRARSKPASDLIRDSDLRVAAVARGIMQHHADDGWFHETRAFAETSLRFAVAIRDHLSPDDGFRPSFLGHILVELLLDAALIESEPERLTAYYQAMKQVDFDLIQTVVNRIASQPTDRLSHFISLFCRERFLCDYADDDKLCFRLNQVMQRVRLPALPASFAQLLPDMRRVVTTRQAVLLPMDRYQ